MILFQKVRYQIWSVLVATILAVCSVASGGPNMESKVIAWPAPTGEVASLDYELTVEGVPVFVHQARVRAKILENKGLWTHEPDCKGETASFAIFDIKAKVEVAIKPKLSFSKAVILPTRAGIIPEIVDGVVRFKIDKPQHLTILVDGRNDLALHLFAGAPETNVPKKGDPNIIYFGPGVHEIETLKIASGQTVYIDGGAVLKAKLRKGETGRYDEKWKITFFDGVIFDVTNAENVRICGRGILDGSLVPHPGRNMIRVAFSKRIDISGITLRDAPNWNVTIFDSENVTVDDLRIISGRLNSDGINSVNSRHVRVRRCFVRNHDDSIVAKTIFQDKPCEDIEVEDCVIWSDWGYALGATYETRSTIRNLRFRRCDILSARHWCLGVHVSDSATVSDIRFEDIRVADLAATRQKNLEGAATLARVAVLADCWGKDPERGHIRDIVVDGVAVDGESMPPSEFYGVDAEHQVENIALRGILLNGKAITDAAALGIKTNKFVNGLTTGK